MAEQEARKYLAEFQLLSKGMPITPHDVATAGRMLAEQWAGNFEHFLDLVVDPARVKYGEGDEDSYHDAHPTDYLDPAQLHAWQILASPDAFRLSDALTLYLKHHPRGAEEAFVVKVSRDWNALIGNAGDILFDQLSRTHARDFVDALTQKGNKTATIRRTFVEHAGCYYPSHHHRIGIDQD